MKFRIFTFILLFVLLSLSITDLEAQCAMCKQVVDSGAKNGSTVAKGLNMGILYLLAVPFLAIGAFTFAFLKRFRANQK